jgi:Tfp pilus assembly protein PilF
MRKLSLASLLALAGCHHGGPNPRTLHYVGKDLVATRSADPQAYAYYVQCQLALSLDPPDLARAHEQILLAIDHDPRDAHLWTVRGQIDLQRGDQAQARRSSERALYLRPDYPPARELAARIAGGQDGPAVAQRRP